MTDTTFVWLIYLVALGMPLVGLCVLVWQRLPRRRPARDLSVSQAARLAGWSNAITSEHLDRLPGFCRRSLASVAAWFALPAMVGLKYCKTGPSISVAAMDVLENDIGASAMEAALPWQAEDPDYADLNRAMTDTVRHFVILWHTAFEDVNAKRFRRHEVVSAMLAGLIRNPRFGLQEVLDLVDEDSVDEVADAFAVLIRESHRRVNELVETRPRTSVLLRR